MAKHRQVQDKQDTAWHLIELGKKFWQSMVKEDTDAALSMLTYHVEQSVAPRGSDGKAQEMVDSSTWVRKEDQWQCVAHTKTPLERSAHRSH